MRALGEYILRSRWHAVLIALLFTFLPLFGWVGVVIMALVTLRKGANEGFFVLAWIALPVIAFSVVLHDYRYALLDALAGSTVVWLMALVLRITNSWLLVVQSVVLTALIVIIAIHIADPNIYQWWQTHLTQMLNQMNDVMGNVFTPGDNATWLTNTPKVATGLYAVFIIVTNLFNLVLARWMQAALFNPGGLKKELHNFRLDKSSIIIVAFLALILVKVPAVADSLPVLLLPFIFAGFSLIHALSETIHWTWIWLLGSYLLFFLLFIYMVFFLIILATADVWLNIRQRMSLVKH